MTRRESAESARCTRSEIVMDAVPSLCKRHRLPRRVHYDLTARPLSSCRVDGVRTALTSAFERRDSAVLVWQDFRVRITDKSDMILAVRRGRKARKQTNKQTNRAHRQTFNLQMNSWINESVLNVRQCNEISWDNPWLFVNVWCIYISEYISG